MRYPTIVYHTPEDGGCCAVVRDLPRCTAHGATPEEALRAAPAAQEGWLEVVPDRRWPIPEPSRRVRRNTTTTWYNVACRTAGARREMLRKLSMTGEAGRGAGRGAMTVAVTGRQEGTRSVRRRGAESYITPPPFGESVWPR